MAQSRLEKVGTIFSRTKGLLRSGAIKPEDKPLWYDVYAAFPPKLEPRYDRPAPKLPIRKIFYAEDVVRAKYQKSLKHQETLNLSDTKRETNTHKFVGIYNNLKAQGALDDEKIFETAKQMLEEQLVNRSAAGGARAEQEKVVEPSSSANTGGANVDIKDLFKD